jgi:hypothetical protein
LFEKVGAFEELRAFRFAVSVLAAAHPAPDRGLELCGCERQPLVEERTIRRSDRRCEVGIRVHVVDVQTDRRRLEHETAVVEFDDGHPAERMTLAVLGPRRSSVVRTVTS